MLKSVFFERIRTQIDFCLRNEADCNMLKILNNRGHKEKQMKILITNDDGIDSPLLKKLAVTAKQFGEVYVVAPDTQRSAVSHGFTYTRPITVKEYPFGVEDVKAYSCDGLPADCVRVGIGNFVPGKPDLVLAGINHGYNIGADIQYSGTVAAAMEAAFVGVHAIAVSQGIHSDGRIADTYLSELLKECIEKPLERNRAWNINFPDCSFEECKGIQRDCTVSKDLFYDDGYEVETNADGASSYSIVARRIWKATPGTDLAAIIANYVSVGIVNNIG